MTIETLTRYRRFFLICSIFGFLVINVPFLYFAFVKTEVFLAAMTNGIALVFISEAFLLLYFFAYLIAKSDLKGSGWLFFVGMSILGGLLFSIPLQLFLISKCNPREDRGATI